MSFPENAIKGNDRIWIVWGRVLHAEFVCFFLIFVFIYSFICLFIFCRGGVAGKGRTFGISKFITTCVCHRDQI